MGVTRKRMHAQVCSGLVVLELKLFFELAVFKCSLFVSLIFVYDVSLKQNRKRLLIDGFENETKEGELRIKQYLVIGF